MRGFGRVYGGQTAVMYLPSAQFVFTDSIDPLESVVHQIDVALRPGTTVEDAKITLMRALPPELTVEEPIQRGIELERNVDGLRATLTGLSSLALLAAMFIVYSANVAMIAYRTSTFATLRSLGVGQRPLRTLVLLEAFATGIVGGAIGLPLGFAMARIALGDVVTGMELNYAVRAAPSDLLGNLRPGMLIFVVLGGVASLLAAFMPSRRILVRYQHTDALPTDTATRSGREVRSRLVALGVAVVAAGAVTLFVGVTSRALWACALGGTVTIVGVVLSFLQLVDRVWRRHVRRAVGRYGAVGWLSAENLVRDTERGLVAVAAIALCGTVAIAAATLPAAFRSSAAHWYGFRGDLTVASRTSGKGWLPAGLLPANVERVIRLPSVARAETLRVMHGQPFHGGRIALVGLSERYLVDVGSGATGNCERAGRALANGSATIVSENFAQRFGVRSGETLVVDSPTGPVSLFVCGTTPDFTSDQGSVIASAEILGTRWRDDLVNYLSIDLRPDADASLFRSELSEYLGATHGLVAYDTGELRAMIEQVLADAFRDVDAIQLLVFFITYAGIIDLVASTVIDRRREFTLLRAVGARDRMIARSVALETGVLGLTAGCLAVVTGMLFSYLWLQFIYPVLVGYVLRHDFAWSAAGVVLVVTCSTAVLAGYTAARVALKSLA
jgi:putative ABC transport system permease protein